MNYLAIVNVMPHKELLDPQGKTVCKNLNQTGLNQILDVRVGKRIEVHIESASQEEAHSIIEAACKNLLANPIMEYYEISIQAI